MDTQASINDGIILTGFTYTISKDGAGEDKYVNIEAAFALKTKPLKGKYIRITAIGYSLNWITGQPISTPVRIIIYGENPTKYDYE